MAETRDTVCPGVAQTMREMEAGKGPVLVYYCDAIQEKSERVYDEKDPCIVCPANIRCKSRAADSQNRSQSKYALQRGKSSKGEVVSGDSGGSKDIQHGRNKDKTNERNLSDITGV